MGLRHMLSFKDFLAVSSTGETELQDVNAKKRHRAVGMWEDAATGAGDIVDPNVGQKRMIVGQTDPEEAIKASQHANVVSGWSKGRGTHEQSVEAHKKAMAAHQAVHSQYAAAGDTHKASYHKSLAFTHETWLKMHNK